MRYFKRRMIIRSIVYSPVAAGVLIVLILFTLNATIKIFGTYLKANNEYAAALNTLAELKKREEGLTNQIKSLETQRGVEEEIRNKFGFVKGGEDVIVIVESPVSTATDSSQAKNGRGLFSSLLHFLTNIFQ